MLKTHAVGIDLGTTYSCIASLNEHGEPVTIPNQEGELSTPSAVLFDGGEVVVGTEALRHAIARPQHVILNSKRFIGSADRFWTVDGRKFTPVDVATFILKKLLAAAEERLGKVEQAVITVPAQFSDNQRRATIEAGMRAGLKQVDIINEPVAAALCYVLGTEGLWFTELADEQRILVYDLGGGTFDLSLVSYKKNEVSVIASGGDLHLGGIDWNEMLQKAILKQFVKDFQADPSASAESLQYLANEVEQAKRSLTVRPRTALSCQHEGNRKTYQVEQGQFEKLTKHLVDRTQEITLRLLQDNKLGWAHVDAVLTTGGSSRMPMIRDRLQQLSGTTLNTSLSPDQSIAHGATYYAGMLLTNNEFARSILTAEASRRLKQVRQTSVNARALGILVRDVDRNVRVPYYLIEANTPLPISATHRFGTVSEGQTRVHLHIVESGANPTDPHALLGNCVINNLPPGLPADSEIDVTIRYDAQARVHVSAVERASGKAASTEIVREENVVVREEPQTEAALKQAEKPITAEVQPVKESKPAPKPAAETPPPLPAATAAPKPRPVPPVKRSSALDESDRPVPLCNNCGEPLNSRGQCTECGKSAVPQKKRPAGKQPPAASRKPAQRKSPPPIPQRKPRPKTAVPPPTDEEIIELGQGAAQGQRKRKPPQPAGKRRPTGKPRPKSPDDVRSGEEDFWNMVE